MSNQSFQQFAANGPPAFGPPTSPPQGAPAFGPPAGPPQPAQAPAWGPPAQAQIPQQAYAPQGQQGYAAPAPQYAAQPPQQQYAPAPQGQQQYAAAPAQAPAQVYDFSGAAPMTGKKNCEDGDYVFEIVSTEQAKTKLGKRGFRTTLKVAHVYEGAQAVGTEVTDWENMGDDVQCQYAGAAMLALAQGAYGCNTPEDLKAGLQSMMRPGPDGRTADGWGELSNAMQLPTVQTSAVFPPNPLKGKYVRARVTSAPNPRKPSEPYKSFAFSPAR